MRRGIPSFHIELRYFALSALFRGAIVYCGQGTLYRNWLKSVTGRSSENSGTCTGPTPLPLKPRSMLMYWGKSKY